MTDGYEVARITITRAFTGDDGEFSDLVDVDVAGDAENILTALGMLDLARDSLLHPPDEY